jgi:hypothetical protein
MVARLWIRLVSEVESAAVARPGDQEPIVVEGKAEVPDLGRVDLGVAFQLGDVDADVFGGSRLRHPAHVPIATESGQVLAARREGDPLGTPDMAREQGV